MLTYPEAIEIVLATLQPLAAVEVELHDALGRVLAAPVQARWDLPPADNSAMDGYAFAFGQQQAGDRLRVEGFVAAGDWSTATVPAGSAVKIMTGAPLPLGCDTVIPFEEIETDGTDILLGKSPKASQHVRRQGEEFRRDETLLVPGTPLFSGEIGLLAAAGISRVRIHPAPRIALLSTGDELVELGEVPGPGQIVNSNAHLLSARLREEGHQVVTLGIARDISADLQDKIARGLQADLLITTGGVSVGDRDLLQETLGHFGFKLGFWRVAIKPGKPVLFGTVQGTPVFGLPGNPAASAATYELFVRPALRQLSGFRDILPGHLRATLTAAVKGGNKRQRSGAA
ncbi:MAG: molybdopterin molybdotransferase MoeA [Desulfuromonadaceae bacterium]